MGEQSGAKDIELKVNNSINKANNIKQELNIEKNKDLDVEI